MNPSKRLASLLAIAALLVCSEPARTAAQPASSQRTFAGYRIMSQPWRHHFSQDNGSDSNGGWSYDGSTSDSGVFGGDGGWDSSVVLINEGGDSPVYVIDDPSTDMLPYPQPSAPPIFSIGLVSAAPMMSATGQLVTLSVQVVGETSNQLDVTWTSQGGMLVENKGASVQWLAPSTPGLYGATVTVTDPQTQQSQSSAMSLNVAGK